MKKGDHVFLIDGSGYIFRAFHALPPLTRPSDGLPTGAIHGFSQMLWKLLRDLEGADRPTHLACIFDTKTNFRNEIYPEYKANRPPAPEDLVPQFPLIRDAVRAFGVSCIEMELYEADDLIATYTRQAQALGATVTIVSSDKDLMQLVDDDVLMLDTMKNRRIDADGVFDKFGVMPDRVIDVQALAGDSVDNVPGVPGIGVKTAKLLIDEYGDLDTLLERAGEIKQKKRRENLIEFADQARISRELVTLKTDVEVEAELDEFAVRDPDPEQLLAFMVDMEFNTLTSRIASALEAKPPVKDMAAARGKANEKAAEGLDGGALLAAKKRAEMQAIPVDPAQYQRVTQVEDLIGWIAKAKNQGFVAFDTETNSLDAMSAQFVGFSLACTPGEACYVPLAHKTSAELGAGGGAGAEQGGLDFGDDASATTLEQMELEAALPLLKELLEDPTVLKIGQNLKFDGLLMKQLDITVAPLDDTMLMSYALDAGKGGHGMDELSKRHLGHTPIPFKEIAGTGKKAITFDYVPLDKATEYAAEDADITLRLWHVLKPRLVAERKTVVYETLERPLVQVLLDMEDGGISVDREMLARLSARFAEKMAEYEQQAYELAGQQFKISSPKQLGEILFDRMELPGGKKTKTGAWQTGAGVLEDLAAQGHDLPQAILNWRSLSKLKSTYTDALPTFINPKTQRIHTSYSMAATNTGRFASSDPNLQNIPIRTPEGREVRKAFVATEGHKLVSADYSQIELRLLAHIADIPALKQAFADGLDIHAMTASEMFNVPLDEMDAETRRRAKAINFGIIYGISAFGLANQLQISRTEAGDYIKTYFKRFPGIKTFMEDIKASVHEHEYVQTLFGRRIHFPEINGKAKMRQSFFERAAVNAPIQGTAADIIRRAMVRMPAALKDAGLQAKMLLQVHDELIFEAPEAECDQLIKLATKVMENACFPAVTLDVPLLVEARAADNWFDAH